MRRKVSRSTKILAGIAALAVCIAGALVLTGRQNGDVLLQWLGVRASFQEKSNLETTPAAMRATKGGVRPAAPPTWPSKDARAVDVIKELDPYSRSGSASASCRISVELQRCESAARVLDAASLVANSTDNANARSSAGRLLSLAEGNLQRCSGVTPELLEGAYQYQQRAANSGSHEMQRWLVQHPALDSTAFLQHLSEWEDYRRRAQQYAHEALRWHERADILPLLQMYSPPSDLHLAGRWSERDDAVFLALLDVANRENVPVPKYLRQLGTDVQSHISDEQLKRYRRLSDELSTDWVGAEEQQSSPDPFGMDVCASALSAGL